MSRGMKVVIVLAIVVAAALFGAAWFFSSVIMYPGPFTCTKEHFVYCGDPGEQGIPFEKVSFKTSDGLTIRGWYMPAGGTKAIVLAHGRGANRNEGMRFARVLHGAGYNLLTFDFRNCGESDKFFNSTGYHEKKDIYAAIDYLMKEKRMKDIGIMGWSQGSATSIVAMAEDKRVRAGIFEAGFANFADAVADTAKRDYELPRYPLLPIVMWLYELRGDLDVSKMNPEDVIGSIAPRPVYIIHGDADLEVYYSHGERLYAAAKQPKQLWRVVGGPHVECWQMDRKRAEGSVAAFFKKYL
jgi:uncharacterized protein